MYRELMCTGGETWGDDLLQLGNRKTKWGWALPREERAFLDGIMRCRSGLGRVGEEVE